jgi:hypothetical protein
MQFSYGSDINVRNRLFFKYGGAAPSSAVLAGWAATFGVEWAVNMQGEHVPAVVFETCEITDLTSPTAGQGSATLNLAGTLAGGVLPAQTSALVNFHIARRYRGGKPRIYGPFLADTLMASPNAWTTTAANNLQSNYADFIARVISNAPVAMSVSNQVNVSYFTLPNTVVTNPITGRARNVPTRRAAPLVDNIVSISVNLKPGSQRRRMQHSS